MSEPERDVEEMEERSERLKREIEDVRDDWQRKQADEKVPGASDEPRPGDEESEGPPPEAEYPTHSDPEE
jgi:hypothetical protein